MFKLGSAAALVAAAVVATPAAAIDPFFPTYGNNGYNVLNYDIDLNANPKTGRIAGRTAILALAEERLERFSLDLHGLTVSRVTVNGLTAAFTRVGDKLRINPPWDLPKNVPFTVAVTYAGVPDALPDPTTPGYRLGWAKFRQGTYVVSEPIGASTFYPANDEPTDKALFTIGVTVPPEFTAVANGELQSIEQVGPNRRFEYRMRQPMTTWLATVQINRYNVHESEAPDGTPIRVYATDATPERHVRIYERAGKMIPWLEDKIGPYPFDTYGSVVVYDPAMDYALETQTVSTFPKGWADDAVVAHELAHQWFGNSAAVERWKDLWIAEGTATYFELLWQFRNDPDGFDAKMIQMHDDLPPGAAVIDAPEQMFDYYTYDRGSVSLYALRLTVGDPKFFRILRTFATLYRGRNASTGDFIDVAVEVSGDDDVRELLNDWLYKDPVPPLPANANLAARSSSGIEALELVGARDGRRHRAQSAPAE